MASSILIQQQLEKDDKSESSSSCSSETSEGSVEDFADNEGLDERQMKAKAFRELRQSLKYMKEQQKRKENGLQQKVRIFEQDFLKDDSIEISRDVYNMTIASNLSGEISPLQINFALKICFFTFLV